MRLVRKHSRFRDDLQHALKTNEVDGSSGDWIPGR